MTALPPPWDRPPTLLDHAVSACLWVVGVLWLVILMPTMMLVGLVLPAHRTDWLNRLYCRGQVALTGARWRAVVDPAVRPDEAYLFACNHVNLLDHTTMYAATPHFKQGMELAEHFDIPVYGWFMKQRGTIPVHRAASRELLRELEQHVGEVYAQGHSILVFPEGTRTRDGRVHRFRRGIFQIAIEHGIPIVPTSVTGMFEIMRTGSRQFRWGRAVTVYCDAPIPTADLRPADAPRLAREVQAIVSERVDAHVEAQVEGAR